MTITSFFFRSKGIISQLPSEVIYKSYLSCCHKMAPHALVIPAGTLLTGMHQGSCSKLGGLSAVI